MKTPIQLSDHFTYNKLLRFTLPSITMMVFTSIYGVVDGFFVSNFAGKTAFAAINLIMPFVMILGGMGFMVGTGGTALVSLVLGTGDRKKANRYFSMMVYLTLIMGVALSVYTPRLFVSGRHHGNDRRLCALRQNCHRFYIYIHAPECIPELFNRGGETTTWTCGNRIRRYHKYGA